TTAREARALPISLHCSGLILIGHLLAANLAELAALDNCFGLRGKLILVLAQLALHLSQQWFVRQLHTATERIAKQLPAELSQECVLPLREQVLTHPVNTLEGGAVHQRRMRVDDTVSEVLDPGAADRVETLERKTVRVDAPVAARTTTVAG